MIKRFLHVRCSNSAAEVVRSQVDFGWTSRGAEELRASPKLSEVIGK